MAIRWVANDFGGLDVFELVEADVPAPGPGEVTIQVRAAGMNPTDFKSVARGTDRSRLPFPVGSEVAGVLSAIGPGTQIASGGGEVGDEVLGYRVSGGYASALTVPAKDVFAKPASLGFPEAANLLLVGATAAEMLDVAGASSGDTILLHGASGSVGTSVLQQARLAGVHVVGTASTAHFEVVRRFGGTPVAYGDGLLDRVREAAPDGVVAALDTVGTDEAVDVSLALVADRDRFVSIAAFGRAQAEGYRVIGGAMPASAAFRDRVRPHLIDLAGRGDLVVPVVRTFPLSQARDALELLSGQHPGGKFALTPE
jgi:NADPH2:quinone reductase